MKTNQSLRLVKVAMFALVTACMGASLANAQTVAGKFDLPFEVRWGQAVLPAGNYSFTLSSTAGMPGYTVMVRGENRTASIIASTIIGDNAAGKSALIVERHGEKGTVRSLRLAEAGLVVYYPAAKAERPVLAQAPALVQQLPILMASR
jgi:hypothetical protein